MKDIKGNQGAVGRIGMGERHIGSESRRTGVRIFARHNSPLSLGNESGFRIVVVNFWLIVQVSVSNMMQMNDIKGNKKLNIKNIINLLFYI